MIYVIFEWSLTVSENVKHNWKCKTQFTPFHAQISLMLEVGTGNQNTQIILNIKIIYKIHRLCSVAAAVNVRKYPPEDSFMLSK